MNEIRNTPAHLRASYSIQEITGHKNKTWCIRVERCGIKKLWVYDQRDFALIYQHLCPTKVGRLCASSWLNVPVRKEIVYKVRPLPGHAPAVALATTLVKPLGMDTPYALLLNAQEEPMALCLYPRVEKEDKWQARLRSGESVDLRTWLINNKLYTCRIH